jgi:hypothetical protein
MTVYVRKRENGWYAVQDNGKLLGKGGKVSWFATRMDAFELEHLLTTEAAAAPAHFVW